MSTQVTLDDDLAEQLRELAARRGEELARVIEGVLREYLKDDSLMPKPSPTDPAERVPGCCWRTFSR